MNRISCVYFLSQRCLADVTQLHDVLNRLKHAAATGPRLPGPTRSSSPPCGISDADAHTLPRSTAHCDSARNSLPSSSLVASSAPKIDATKLLSGIGDLQRVGPAVLQAAKAKMEVLFEAHRVKPGEEGYEYDKRVEFTAAVEPSEWDD